MNKLNRQGKNYGFVANNEFYTSKVEALSKVGDISKVQLYFLNDEWASVDWSKEPTESFEELMNKRCIQIRNQYDHVSLFFSGGYDSNTILNAFLRNGLLIDEMIFWEREWVPFNRPETDYAVGIAKELKKTIWPNLKITHYYRKIEHMVDYYKKWKDDWIFSPGNWLGLTKTVRDWEFEHTPEIVGRHDDPRRVIIEGRDKPRLDFRDNRWYVTMNDHILKDCMNNSALQFYFDPDFPQLHVKQCHMMIRWLENNYDITHEFIHQLQSHLTGNETYEKWNRAIGRDEVIFPVARYGTGTKKLFQGGAYSLDSQLVEQHMKVNHPDIHRMWEHGLTTIKKEWSNSWDSSKNELKTVLSPEHFVRDYRPKSS